MQNTPMSTVAIAIMNRWKMAHPITIVTNDPIAIVDIGHRQWKPLSPLHLHLQRRHCRYYIYNGDNGAFK